MSELHFTKKDFDIEWFSGTGKGGQHRNKHQNCCRIRHRDTGISATGTASRSRITNQDAAFRVLAARLLAHLQVDEDLQISNEVIRHYSACRNSAKDAASGETATYREVVEKGDIGMMVEARRKAIAIAEEWEAGA